MSYIGVEPKSGFIKADQEKITGQTTNYVNLTNSISSLDDVQIWVNYVIQDPSTLTLNSSTQVGLGDTLVSSDVVLVTYLGQSVATQNPANNSVTNDMLSGSIANSKLANSSITLNGSAVSLGGSATVDNTPNFHAYKSSDQSIAFQNNVKITFETEDFDSDNAFSSSTFTVPSGKDGKYFLYASIQTNSSEDFDDYQIKIYKNGSLASGTRDRHFLSETIKTFTVLSLSATDYIEVYAYVGSGSNKTIVAESTGVYFGGFKIIE